jgi:hypothetical protein
VPIGQPSATSTVQNNSLPTDVHVAPDRPPRPQMLLQFLREHAAGLDEPCKTSFQKSVCRSCMNQNRLLIMTGDGETIVCRVVVSDELWELVKPLIP